MTLRLLDPSTGKLVRELETDTPTDLATKVARARAAQPAWAALPLEIRLACLRSFRASLGVQRERLAALLTSETGKPITQALGEIAGVGTRIDYFVEKVPALLVTDVVHTEPGLEERVDLEPLGVVANVSAWNYPFFVGGNVFVPALLTGNAVVYKPSELAPLTGLAIAELLHAAGVPEDVFVTVVGAGDVGQALLENPLDGIFFTGSYATGAKIADAARARMIPVGLELGGKDPAYVTDDVDPTAAAAALADGAFYNAGQSCCAVERIYVHENVYDAFVAAFLTEVRGFVVGEPTDPKTNLGPLTRAAQLDVLTRQVEDARTKGANVALGGKRVDRAGNFFEPTVLLDVTHDMLVMKEESFGPIIGIQKVSGDEEGAALMRDTEYGLTAGVFCRDVGRAERLLRTVSAGSAYINCCDRVSPRLPWSGRGHSGLGSTLGTLGVLAFVRPKAWHVRS